MRRLRFSFVVVTLINFIVPNFHINGVWGAESVPKVPQPEVSEPSGFLQQIGLDSEKLLNVSALVQGVEAQSNAKVVIPPPAAAKLKREHPFHLLFNRELNQARDVKNPQGISSPIELSRNVFGDFFSLFGLGGSEVNTTASPAGSPGKASDTIPEVPPVPTPPKLEVIPPAELPKPAPAPKEEESKPEAPAKKVKREDIPVISEDNKNNASAPIPPLNGIFELFVFTIVPTSNVTNSNVTESRR